VQVAVSSKPQPRRRKKTLVPPITAAALAIPTITAG
jgi:hypothetical protein